MSQDEEIANKVIELLKTKPTTGISNDDIQKNLSVYTPQQRLTVINDLIIKNRIELLKKGNNLIYRLKEPSKHASTDMDNDEQVIYNIIEAAGNTGIWVKDIRVKSNLAMQPLTKILNNMEKRKLIKAVKSVNASKKKVYMLYDLEPDTSVTGGAWYQDSDFETEFVDVLNAQCLRFLVERRTQALKHASEGPSTVFVKSICSVKEVHSFIKELQISKIELKEADLEDILKTVVYDGKAQRIVKAEGVFYKAIDSLLPMEGIVQTPCGICPVINNCSDSVGSITPKTCVYMKEWLE